MRILVVEDEAKLATVLKKGLEERGHAVDIAPDGLVALSLVRATEYDCAILDLMLPYRSGDDVCLEIRRLGRKMPVLVLSARSDTHEKIRLLDLGADDYLTKPFSFAELLARLRALQRRGSVEAKRVLQVGDLELDPASLTVRREGRKIPMTKREFSVLEYLMRHAGHVVTRSMMLEHVWNLDYDGGSNIVEVYINYLRRKIDQDFEQKLIHTVRGSGYVLREPG